MLRPLAALGLLICALPARALPPGCRGSAAPVDGSQPRMLRGKTVEGRAYEIRIEESGGSGGSTTTATVLMGGKPVVTVAANLSFSAMTQAIPIPPELRLKDMSTVKDALEVELFHAKCGSPDPSLARLLSPNGKLAWIAGKPVMPGWYAIERGEGRKNEWIYYLGGTHGTAPWEPIDLDATPGVAKAGNLLLVPTAHGAVLYDAERDRHAWIWVTPSWSKLRRPSIASVRFEGKDTAVVTLQAEDGAKPGVVSVDLRSGKTKRRG